MRRNTPWVVTRATAMAIRREYAMGASSDALADVHGVSPATVRVIVAGRHPYTEGMQNIARGRGKPCDHSRSTVGRRRCIHAQLGVLA